MGTLGCIQDMQRRDKENREWRKRNKERFTEQRQFLAHQRKKEVLPQITREKLDDIRHRMKDQERIRQHRMMQDELLLLCVILLLVLLGWACFMLFFH